ncbi:MAG: hypothetical protein IJ409_01760 [Lachnospiraceae bacterium]|nr:hypothetical protein [Lachnospiraceae bacterium]
MDKCKKIGKALLFPGWGITILLVIASAFLLWYAFGYENPNPVITYAGYALSAYALTVVVAKMPPIVKKIRAGLYSNRYSGKYLSEPELRAKISLYAGLAINTVYAVLKFLAGIYFRSVWLGAIAVYYIILSLIRFGLVKRQRYSVKYEDPGEQREHELKSYRFCGFLMFLLNIAVTALVVQMIWQNKSYSYPGFLIYAFAAYAFYCLAMAIKNMIKYRKMEQPILSAAKMISFACALISILACQTAMLTQFGDGQENFARLMNSLTGGVVCFMIFAMAVWMIKKANDELKSNEENENERAAYESGKHI